MSASDPRRMECDSKEPRIKCRYTVILIGFAAHFFFCVHGIALNVGIVAMVNNSAVARPAQEIRSNSCLPLMSSNSSHVENSFARTYETEDGEFSWDTTLQSYILGSSFLSFVIAIAPIGKMTQSYGCKKMLFWSTFFPAVLTFITPLAAWCGVYVVIFVQSLRGAAQAGIVPAQSILIANWCPKAERGFSFTVMLTGTCWGAIIGTHVVGLLSHSSWLGGWPSIFYVLGGAGIIVSLSTGYFMHNSPKDHPGISKAEFQFIINNQENVLTQERPEIPWGKLISSIPLYALAFAYFGQMWALSHFLTVHPIYHRNILHYSMEQSVLLWTLPFLLQIMTALAAGWLSVYLNKKNLMSIDKSRKFWNFMSCIGYSACLLGIYIAGCNKTASVVFSILSLSCTGFACTGCWITSTDMSPAFAGLVNSIAWLFGLTSNYILPAIVGHLTSGTQTVDQWNKVLFISIGVILSSGTVFTIFGSAEVQPWNNTRTSLERNFPCPKKSVTLDQNSRKQLADNVNNEASIYLL